MDPTALQELKASIRTIPDYPRAGIQFRDIRPKDYFTVIHG